MPKMKTRKSIQKRIKITGSGKLLRGFSMANHLKMAKSKKQIRRHRGTSIVVGKLAARIRRLIAA